MKHTIKHHLVATAMLALASIVFASSSFAAHNDYLTLKGGKSGKSYKSSIDAHGTFSFANVAPGEYTLTLVCDDGGGTSGPPNSIEIESFSWGSSNSRTGSSNPTSGKESVMTPGSHHVSRSNMSNNRVTSPGGVAVATGDVDGDGVPDKITSPMTFSGSSLTKVGMTYQKIVFENVMVSSVCTATGACNMKWDIKKNTR